MYSRSSFNPTATAISVAIATIINCLKYETFVSDVAKLYLTILI